MYGNETSGFWCDSLESVKSSRGQQRRDDGEYLVRSYVSRIRYTTGCAYIFTKIKNNIFTNILT